MAKKIIALNLPTVDGTAALNISDMNHYDEDYYQNCTHNDIDAQNPIIIDFTDYSSNNTSVLHELFYEGKLYNGFKGQNLSGQPISGISRRESVLAGLIFTVFAFVSVFFGV